MVGLQDGWLMGRWGCMRSVMGLCDGDARTGPHHGAIMAQCTRMDLIGIIHPALGGVVAVADHGPRHLRAARVRLRASPSLN